MADIFSLVLQSVAENWMLFALVITSVLCVVPWAALLLLNFFNKNIINEIKATFNRKAVRVFYFLQNGQSRTLYKEMNDKKEIIMASDKRTGIDTIITPTTSPHPDSESHRQTYVSIQGQEGTKDLLKDSKYDVNSPQKKMTFSMAFENGREYERTFANADKMMDLMQLTQIALPTLLLLLVLFFQYSQTSVIEAIATAVGATV